MSIEEKQLLVFSFKDRISCCPKLTSTLLWGWTWTPFLWPVPPECWDYRLLPCYSPAHLGSAGATTQDFVCAGFSRRRRKPWVSDALHECVFWHEQSLLRTGRLNGPWDGGASVSHVGQAKGGWESFPQMLGVVMSSNWGVHSISLQAETAYLQLPLPLCCT